MTRKPMLGALALLALAGVAEAGPIAYRATLSGAAENPPVASSGTGIAIVTLDRDADRLAVYVSFDGLTGNTTVAHVHCCVAPPGNVGVATRTPSFLGFPAGVKEGDYFAIFDTSLASTWNANFINANGGTPAGAEAAFAAGLDAGRAYFNLHSSFAPGGELRGFLTEVPAPASLALLGLGLFGLAALRRVPGRADGGQAASPPCA